jgi:DNA (cytosine-5)-methyltransferase 1
MGGLRFIDLFAGLGGFHIAMSRRGHECVFASELDEDLRAIYARNFPEMKGNVYGNIREWKHKVTDHDFLCAGFPCQPFSKSEAQLGTQDETRGLGNRIGDLMPLH